MPGYVIHLAVAEEYLRKQKKVKENYNDFIAMAICITERLVALGTVGGSYSTFHFPFNITYIMMH